MNKADLDFLSAQNEALVGRISDSVGKLWYGTDTQSPTPPKSATAFGAGLTDQQNCSVEILRNLTASNSKKLSMRFCLLFFFMRPIFMGRLFLPLRLTEPIRNRNKQSPDLKEGLF